MNRTIKTLFSGLASLFIAATLSAQPPESSIMVGSSFGLTGKRIDNEAIVSGTENKKDELFSMGFAPRIGYHFSEHLLAGISLKYGKKILEDDNGELGLFTIGPFLRYYLFGRKFAPYLEAEAGTGNYNETTLAALTLRSKVFYVSGGGGIEYYFSPAFSLDGGVNYKKTMQNPEISMESGKEIIRNLNFRAGIAIHLFWKNDLKMQPESKKRSIR